MRTRDGLRLLAPGVLALVIFFGCLGAMAYYSLLPSLGMAKLGSGITLKNYAAFLGDSFYLSYLWRSLRIASYTTVLALVTPIYGGLYTTVGPVLAAGVLSGLE